MITIKRNRNIATLAILCLLLVAGTHLTAQERRQLKVSMYPFVPDADNLYKKIKQDFEAKFPKIELVFSPANWNYYKKGKGVDIDTADIIELDCIFLQSFIDNGKVQAMPNDFFVAANLMPAGTVVNQKPGYVYGVPHWICGNFLYYQKSDKQIKDAKTFTELEKAIGTEQPVNKQLLVDLKGDLTLSEYYSDALMDNFQSKQMVINHASWPHFDNYILSYLNRVTPLTNTTWTRDSQKYYHNVAGGYPMLFAKGSGRALVGYTEGLYYFNKYLMDSCKNNADCLAFKNIDVKDFNLSETPYNPAAMKMGWVDALTINANVKGQKLLDAKDFIKFVISQKGYYDALIPENNDAPRYLLPAYRQYYTDRNVLAKAPFYTQLFPYARQLSTVTAPTIGADLQTVGAKIDSLLPAK